MKGFHLKEIDKEINLSMNKKKQRKLKIREFNSFKESVKKYIN